MVDQMTLNTSDKENLTKLDKIKNNLVEQRLDELEKAELKGDTSYLREEEPMILGSEETEDITPSGQWGDYDGGDYGDDYG